MIDDFDALTGSGMQLHDVPVSDLVERWFGGADPYEPMPGCVAWLPEQIKRQYASTSRLLWHERSLWPIRQPKASRMEPFIRMIFMADDEGEWLWSHDPADVDRIFDTGPDEAGWSVVDGNLSELIAVRNLLEIAHGPISHKRMSAIPATMLPSVVTGLSEISAITWRSLPGLRLHIGDGMLVASMYSSRSVAPFDPVEDTLHISIAATDPGKFDYLADQEWPRRWIKLSPRVLGSLG